MLRAEKYLREMREWGFAPQSLDYERCMRTAAKVRAWVADGV